MSLAFASKSFADAFKGSCDSLDMGAARCKCMGYSARGLSMTQSVMLQRARHSYDQEGLRPQGPVHQQPQETAGLRVEYPLPAVPPNHCLVRKALALLHLVSKSHSSPFTMPSAPSSSASFE